MLRTLLAALLAALLAFLPLLLLRAALLLAGARPLPLLQRALRLLGLLERRLRLFRRRVSVLPGQPVLQRLNVLRQLIRPVGEPLRLLRCRLASAVGHRALFLRQLFRFIAECLQRPLERGALEDLRALLEGLAELLLLLGKLRERLPGLIGRELLRRVIQLLQCCEHFGRQRLAQHALRFA